MAAAFRNIVLLLLLAAAAAASQDSTERSSCAVPKRSSQQEALNELFTCFFENQVSQTIEYKTAQRINFKGVAGNGVSKGPLLTDLFSRSQLLFSEQPGYLQFMNVVGAFNEYLGEDENRGPGDLAKIASYMRFLKLSGFIKDTFATLKANDALPNVNSVSQFVDEIMWDQWFKLYARNQKNHLSGLRESSGFGHVMVGEIRSSGVTGFHCWVQVLAGEEAGDLDYLGYVRKVSDPLNVGGIQFKWRGNNKSMSSFIFGAQPEFDLALFTASFVVNPGRKSNFMISGKSIGVQTYRVNHQPESIGTAYVVV